MLFGIKEEKENKRDSWFLLCWITEATVSIYMWKLKLDIEENVGGNIRKEMLRDTWL